MPENPLPKDTIIQEAYRMGKIFPRYTYDRGLVYRIYKELKNLYSKEVKNSILKMWHGTESSQKMK